MYRKAEYREIDMEGFTLVELLVVISIISLIMAITLPWLSEAREQGKRVTCLANMRNLTQGWIMYAQGNDDKLCSSRTNWHVPPENHWVADGPWIPGNTVGGTAQAIKNGVLWPYVAETLDVYKCKSDRSERLRSYAIIESMNGWEQSSVAHPMYRRLSDVTPAGQRMVFLDAECLTPWISGPFPVPRMNMGNDQILWTLDPTHSITARHSRGCNVSFADGHCEYLKYRDPRTVSLADLEADDRDLSDNPDVARIMEWAPRWKLQETDPNNEGM